MGIKFDIDEYEDFFGTIVKIKKNLFKRNLYYVYLQDKDKQIRVRLGGNDWTIGQKIEVGHCGEQVINISYVSHRPFSRVTSKKSYFCKLCNKSIKADECIEIQHMRRKPDEMDVLPFDLENSNSYCPECSYNQCR